MTISFTILVGSISVSREKGKKFGERFLVYLFLGYILDLLHYDIFFLLGWGSSWRWRLWADCCIFFLLTGSRWMMNFKSISFLDLCISGDSLTGVGVF